MSSSIVPTKTLRKFHPRLARNARAAHPRTAEGISRQLERGHRGNYQDYRRRRPERHRNLQDRTRPEGQAIREVRPRRKFHHPRTNPEPCGNSPSIRTRLRLQASAQAALGEPEQVRMESGNTHTRKHLRRPRLEAACVRLYSRYFFYPPYRLPQVRQSSPSKCPLAHAS